MTVMPTERAELADPHGGLADTVVDVLPLLEQLQLDLVGGVRGLQRPAGDLLDEGLELVDDDEHVPRPHLGREVPVVADAVLAVELLARFHLHADALCELPGAEVLTFAGETADPGGGELEVDTALGGVHHEDVGASQYRAGDEDLHERGLAGPGAA